MSLTSTEPRVRKALDEWATMSRNRSFMLARMTLADACGGYADADVLLAITDAAARDTRRAQEQLAKARTALAGDGVRLMTDVPRSVVQKAADRLAAALDARVMLTPPRDLMEWLERPDLIPAPPATAKTAATPSSSYAGSGGNAPPSTARPASTPMTSTPGLPSAASLALGSMPSVASMMMTPTYGIAGSGSAPAATNMSSLPTPVLGSVAPPPALPQIPGMGLPSAQQAPRVASYSHAPAATAPPFSTPTAPATVPPPPAPVRPAPPAFVPPPAPVAPPAAQAPPPVAVAPAPPRRPAAPSASANQWDDWEARLLAMASAGQLGEALRQAEEAAGKYPQSARLAEFLAAMHQRAGNVDRAVESYLSAVERAAKSGNLERAERAGREAIALSRQSATTLMHVAKVTAAAGIGAVALVALREAASRMAASTDRPRLASVLEFLTNRLPPDPALYRDIDRLKRDIMDATERGQAVASDARDVAAWANAELPASVPRSGGGGGRPPTLQIVGQPAPLVAPPPRVSPPTSAEAYHRASRDDAQRKSRALNASVEPPPAPPRPRAGAGRPSTTVEAPNSLGFVLAGFAVLAIVFAMLTGSVLPGMLGFFISQAVITAMGTKGKDDPSRKAAEFARMCFVVAFFFGLFL